MSARKIVAVKFDDGTEREVRDIVELRQYIEKLYLEACIDGAFPHADQSSRRMLMDTTKALKQLRIKEESETKRANASAPRNAFAKKPTAKAELLAFLDQYEKDNGKTHGGMTAACSKFLCDMATLKKIRA